MDPALKSYLDKLTETLTKANDDLRSDIKQLVGRIDHQSAQVDDLTAWKPNLEAFGNSKPALEHASTPAASQLLLTDAPASPTTTVDVVPVLTASSASAKPLDIDATGVAAPMPTTCSTDGTGHDSGGNGSVAVSLLPWSTIRSFTAPLEASLTQPCRLFVALELDTKALTRCSTICFVDETMMFTYMFVADVTQSITRQGQVLRPIPWPSFNCHSGAAYTMEPSSATQVQEWVWPLPARSRPPVTFGPLVWLQGMGMDSTWLEKGSRWEQSLCSQRNSKMTVLLPLGQTGGTNDSMFSSCESKTLFQWYPQEEFNHNIGGDDPMAVCQTTWSAPASFTTQQEAFPTPSRLLFAILEMNTLLLTRCSMNVPIKDASTVTPKFTPGALIGARSTITMGDVAHSELRPLPWPSFACNQVWTWLLLEKYRGLTRIISSAIPWHDSFGMAKVQGWMIEIVELKPWPSWKFLVWFRMVIRCTRVSIWKKKLLGLITGEGSDGFDSHCKHEDKMELIVLYGFKQVAYYPCFFGLHAGHLYISNLIGSFGNIPERLRNVHNFIGEALWKDEKHQIDSHPSLHDIEMILRSDTRISQQILIVADTAFWLPFGQKLTSMKMTFVELGKDPAAAYLDPVNKTNPTTWVLGGLPKSDCILLDNENISASFPFSEFGIVLEYGGPNKLSTLLSLAPNLYGFPRLNFLYVKVDTEDPSVALVEDNSTYQELKATLDTVLHALRKDLQEKMNKLRMVASLHFIPATNQLQGRQENLCNYITSGLAYSAIANKSRQPFSEPMIFMQTSAAATSVQFCATTTLRIAAIWYGIPKRFTPSAWKFQTSQESAKPMEFLLVCQYGKQSIGSLWRWQKLFLQNPPSWQITARRFYNWMCASNKSPQVFMVFILAHYKNPSQTSKARPPVGATIFTLVPMVVVDEASQDWMVIHGGCTFELFSSEKLWNAPPHCSEQFHWPQTNLPCALRLRFGEWAMDGTGSSIRCEQTSLQGRRSAIHRAAFSDCVHLGYGYYFDEIHHYDMVCTDLSQYLEAYYHGYPGKIKELHTQRDLGKSALRSPSKIQLGGKLSFMEGRVLEVDYSQDMTIFFHGHCGCFDDAYYDHVQVGHPYLNTLLEQVLSGYDYDINEACFFDLIQVHLNHDNYHGDSDMIEDCQAPWDPGE